MGVPLLSLEIVQPPDVSERDHRKFSNAALRAAAVNHLLTKSPRHFQRNAQTAIGGEYGYTARTKKYMIRKARKMGHQTPNVFTGREALYVLSNARVTATYEKARVVYRALHPRTQQQAERWIREMEAISAEEALEASGLAAQAYHRQLETHRASRAERKRVST